MERNDWRPGDLLQRILVPFALCGMLMGTGQGVDGEELGEVSGKWTIFRGGSDDAVELGEIDGALQGHFTEGDSKQRFPVTGRRRGNLLFFSYTVKTELPNHQTLQALHSYVGKLDGRARMTGEFDLFIDRTDQDPAAIHLSWVAIKSETSANSPLQILASTGKSGTPL